MNTTDSIALAQLAAVLARRNPAISTGRVASDANDLLRLGKAAETQAVNLCNIPDYQMTYDRKQSVTLTKAAVICGHYGLRAETSGDPRGYCLRLFDATGTNPVRGNTMGGDESGYGI